MGASGAVGGGDRVALHRDIDVVGSVKQVIDGGLPVAAGDDHSRRA